MKRIIFLLLALISVAHAQDSASVRAKKQPIKEFKIWYQGQLLDADNLEVDCVEDDLATFANFKYTLTDSVGQTLAMGFLKMTGPDYNLYLTRPNHGDRATAWVMAQLKLQVRVQRQAVQSARAASTSTSTGTTSKQ
jgi:hypothetical protein